MASAISESAVYEASIIGPDDGDARNAASVRTGMQDLANRTNYLNANKANLAGPTFTGNTVTGNLNVNGGGTAGGAILQTSNGAYNTHFTTTLSDADATLFSAATDLSLCEYRMPAITANRVLTFSATNTPSLVSQLRKRVRVVRMRTADAFTVTVRRSDATTIGVISASSAGWIEFCFDPGIDNWVVSAWGGTVTSLSTDVG